MNRTDRMDAYRQHYQSQAIQTASPAQLVQMLYQGALAALTRAEQTMRANGSIEAAHRDLVKAQDIVTELMLSLDHDAGGEIAANLASLYDFCLDRIQTANMHKTPELLGSVRRTLGELSEAWDEVIRTQLAAPAVAVG